MSVQRQYRIRVKLDHHSVHHSADIFYPHQRSLRVFSGTLTVGGGYGRLTASGSGSGAGVTDGLRLDDRRFTVHRIARRRDGGTAASEVGGRRSQPAMRQR